MKKIEYLDLIRFILNVVLDISIDPRTREQAWDLLYEMSPEGSKALRQGIETENEELITDSVINFCEFSSLLDQVDLRLQKHSG